MTTAGLYTAPATAGSAVVRVTDSEGNTADAGVTVAAPIIAPCGATRIRLISGPECITSVSGKIRSQYEPLIYDELAFNVRHMGRRNSAESLGEVSRSVTYDVGAYTGFRPPAPYSDWQRGYYDIAESGTNAFQWHCSNVGSMINTWSFDHTEEVVGGGPQSTLEIRYSDPPAPWQTPTSELVLQAYVMIPWVATWNGGVGQLNFIAYLRDKISGQVFAYVLPIFDSRPAGVHNGDERPDHDTQTAYISSPLKPGMSYSTVASCSATMQNEAPFSTRTFFGAHIPGAKLVAAIEEINETATTKFSEVPGNYVLELAGIQHEVFVGTDPAVNISMGVSIDGFAVYESY